MPEENGENKLYPVKTLHDFLLELDREWTKFRNGTLVALFSSGILLVIAIWLILVTRHFRLGFLDFAFFIFVVIIAAYSIYATYAQYSFLSKWERRIGLLVHLEEQMLSEKLDETKA